MHCRVRPAPTPRKSRPTPVALQAESQSGRSSEKTTVLKTTQVESRLAVSESGCWLPGTGLLRRVWACSAGVRACSTGGRGASGCADAGRMKCRWMSHCVVRSLLAASAFACRTVSVTWLIRAACSRDSTFRRSSRGSSKMRLSRQLIALPVSQRATMAGRSLALLLASWSAESTPWRSAFLSFHARQR